MSEMCNHIFLPLYDVKLLCENPNTNRMLHEGIVATTSKYWRITIPPH
jgi:hypothetical protein